MVKICIYAICKNEIKFVDKWLDSMQEADYIVVLDTGSTDGTYEKLAADPRVTRLEQKEIKPWRFDVARNESMKLVPEDADVLFCTDFDEVLEPGWGALIRENWKPNTMRGRYQYIWSHTDTGAAAVTYVYDKMHNRDYQWYFPVHEVLGLDPDPVKMLDKEAAQADRLIDFGQSIVLHHYPDPEKSRSSYLDLLKLRWEENPNDCYSSYLLAREYGVYRDYDSALELFEKTLELTEEYDFAIVRQAALGGMGDIHLYRQNYPEAIVCFTLQVQTMPDYRDGYVRLAECYDALGATEAAVGFIKEAFKKTFQHYDWSEHSEMWTGRPENLLSYYYLKLGNYKEALPQAIKALQADPNNKQIQENYLHIISQIKD